MLKRCEFDERNTWGRETIRKRLLDHQSSLANVKPTLNFRTPPRQTSASKLSAEQQRKRILRTTSSGNEAFFSVKKVYDVKLGIDSKEPKTFRLTNHFVPMHQRENNFIKEIHDLNLKSHQRKMREIGKSMTERKKNLFDPIAYPTRFMRRTSPDPKKKSQENMFSIPAPGSIVMQTYELPKLKKRISQQRLNTAGSMSSRGWEHNPAKETLLTEEPPWPTRPKPRNIKDAIFPAFNCKSEEDYQELKEVLFEIIVDYRLFRDEDFEVLKEKISKENPKLNQEMVQKIFKEIIEEFDA